MWSAPARLAVLTCALAGSLALAALPLAEGVQAGAQASVASRPKVRLIATGGTISARPGGRLTADELVAAVPTLDAHVRAETEQFSNVSSAALTIPQLLDLSRRINAAFGSDDDLAGVVVTSGTDTLEEIAYFLNLTVRSDRPVVVAGAMRSPGTIGHDGPANLLAAFRVAADPAARGKGVLVVLNDEIHAAREVTKTDTLRLDSFQSRPTGALGAVDADRVVFRREGVKRHTSRSEFDVTATSALPRVDIVLVYQDANGDAIRSLVDLGCRGIVIASAGAGAVSGTQAEGIRYAIGKGAVVVTSSRTGGGRVPPRTIAGAAGGAPSIDRARAIPAEDLAPVKARILLMLALSTTSDASAIGRMFQEY